MGIYKAAAKKKYATIVVNGKGKFPMKGPNDKGHARAALARLNQARPPLTASQKAKVRARAHRILGTKKAS